MPLNPATNPEMQYHSKLNCYKLLGIHKQQAVPVLIDEFSLPETALQKKKEIETSNMDFFKKFEKFQLSLQPLSARELKEEDPGKYNEYINKHRTDSQVKIQEFIQDNAPEFVDFNIYII